MQGLNKPGVNPILSGLLQWFSEIIDTTTKNGAVPVSTRNVKLFFMDHMVGEVENNSIIYL